MTWKDWLDEYEESKKDPTAFTGPMRRCDYCGVSRNMFHLRSCETQKKPTEENDQVN